MWNTMPLDEIEALLRALEDVRQKMTSLPELLDKVAQQCRLHQWMTDGAAEMTAAELCQIVSAQQKLRAGRESLLGDSRDLSAAKERLEQEAQRARAASRDGKTVRRFCALETGDENLAALLPARKAHLRELMEPGADEAVRRAWLDACALLLEYLDAPDIGKSQELFAVFQNTLGVEFFAGIYSGKLTLPAGWEEDGKPVSPAPPQPEPQPRPEPGAGTEPEPEPKSEAQAVPLPGPEKGPEPEAPDRAESRPKAGAGASPRVVFEGPKRNQDVSVKRLCEALKKPQFLREVTILASNTVITQGVPFRSPEPSLKQLAAMVQEGYVTRIELRQDPPLTFYMASPKLCQGFRKQTVQDLLRKTERLSIDSLPEEMLTPAFLMQVYLTQSLLCMLSEDKRLVHWGFDTTHIHILQDSFRIYDYYRIHMTFTSNYSEDLSVQRCVLSLEGVTTADAAGRRLDGPYPPWVVVRRREEIAAWSEKLAAWGLPLPEWASLDAPGQYFLPDGAPRDLLELFPPKPEPDPPGEEPSGGASAPGEEPSGGPSAPGEEPSGGPSAPEEEPSAGLPALEEEPSAGLPALEEEPSGGPPALEEEPSAGPSAPEKIPPAPPSAPEKPRTRLTLFTMEPPGIDFQVQAAQWAAAEKFPLTLCLMRSAASYDPALTGLQKQLAYALDDPMEECEYLDDRLSDVYACACQGPWEAQGVFQLLRASAYLRMAFSGAVSQQSYQIADSLQGFSGEGTTPSLSQAFHLLSQFVRTQRRGVDRQIIRQVRQQGDTSASLEELAKAAERTRGRRWNVIEHKMERIKMMFDDLFGNQGATMQLLDLVAKQRTDRREAVLGFCKENRLIDAEGMPDQNGIARFIDWTWQSVPAKRGKNATVTGTARTQAMNRMTSCVDIFAKWLELTDENPLNDVKDAVKQCKQLAVCLSRAREELREMKDPGICATAARAVLDRTLEDLEQALQGNSRGRDAYFVEFLYTGYIELDGRFRPVLERPELMIPGCEPWERLLRHDAAMMKGQEDWDAPVARILGGDERQPDYRNFGSAQLILRYCLMHALPVPARLAQSRLEDDDRRTLIRVKEREDRFRAELELAATYGQIEDNTHKERLVTAITKQQREHFDETRNWGSYFLLMQACLDAVRKSAEQLEPRYRYEFDHLKQTMDDCPLFEDIERLLEQKMFSVAHDYMQLAEKENITEAPQGNILQQPREKDNLRRFLDTYNTLQHRSAEGNDKETLHTLARSLHGGELSEGVEKLLQAWPQNGQADPVQLQNLFRALGFPVARVEARKGGRFRVQMNASAASVFHYPHPISAYGTELFPSPDQGDNSGMDVYILNGKRTVDELEQKISGLGLDSRPTIFLLNWSIPLADRRALAQKLKKDCAHPATAIVLDRVLMLFLARYPRAERTQVLLQCALPFHSYNPYTEGIVAPEMFMGRDAQLGAILRNGQANIIYGGRQLGKTALLRRAASLEDDRRRGRWAIYTDKICRQDYGAALLEVYKCLWQNGFLDKAEPPRDWGELCDRIQARMDRPGGRVERFLLLLDEADRFLESSSALSYRPVEYLYQLETATKNRFKFVLAGLHNVMRFSREGSRNNSVLGKLGSLTIKPLTFQEASQLLELPLYYMGFRMRPEQDVLLSQILLSTNYYPGLIQFYCRQLVDSLSAKRASDNSTPPYLLDEGTIRNLLQKEDFVKQIREKYFITLDVEEGKLYYRALAYTLAYCYYDSPQDSVEGYTFEQLREVYEGFEIRGLCELEAENVKTLLSEMEDLNVLVQLDGRYSFNGANFRHMMGSEETIMNELDRLGGEAR